ncbi:MAG TPA: hypothetical protein VHP83_07380 [Aggregatilineaceae bacterium]|nr:hypothetical protein [Aggregatilineaceae bacterium]
MREELFSRGIISQETFENEVYRKAIESQRREGLTDPLYAEPEMDWDKRVRYILEHLTDFYFAYNLPYSISAHFTGCAAKPCAGARGPAGI